ncbi:MAG TPA: hypothetical protein VHP30_10435, partial [Ignavibacteriales bacterium]|nr:hypothetical protein [Ignavibacteriales bacterium]
DGSAILAANAELSDTTIALNENIYYDKEVYSDTSFIVHDKECKVSIKLVPEGDILLVNGIKHKDNVVYVKNNYDEKELFNKIIRKSDFKNVHTESILKSAVFDSFNDENIVLFINIITDDLVDLLDPEIMYFIKYNGESSYMVTYTIYDPLPAIETPDSLQTKP